MAVGHIGAVRTPPKLPAGNNDPLAMLTLLADPERTAEAKTYLADLNAATEENARVTAQAREAVAEAQARIDEAERREAEVRELRTDLAEHRRQIEARQAERSDELQRREQQVGERETALDRKAAEVTAGLDVIRRARERLAEVD